MQLQLTKHPGATLADAKAKLRHDIDVAAGVTRSRFITIVPGQAETYQAKAANAKAYKAAGSPGNAAPFPWIAAEAQAQGLTPDQAADLVLTLEAQWAQLGAAIEGYRIGGKNLVATAATLQEAIAVTASTVNSLNQL